MMIKKLFRKRLTVILCSSLLLLFFGSANAATANPNVPDVTLPAIARGEKAIRDLGDKLPAVAKAYGLTAEELKYRFKQDKHLAVDRKGRLFFEDPAELPQGAETVGTETVSAASYSLDQTFLLHSRPGAKRVIYLDFDGHLLSGTAWNSSYNSGSDIVCPAWNIDGNASVFGDTERTIIQEIWQRVSEDYIPYDVDVTTEYPGEAVITRSSSSDDTYGMRVLISPISSYVGNYGGVAYVGAYNDVGDYYKPALVFPEKLGNSARYIAEAITHETGHTLGLYHDGTTTGTEYYSGQGGWAPIMGVGYYQTLTQWSKGEYANANNKQDDLAVMLNYGLSYRTDDYGNTDATACYLTAGAQLSADGIIERNTDVDVIAFATLAGTINLNITPLSVGADLDILAELYDSSGALVASSNPMDFLAASLSLLVDDGMYYLHIRGTGKGDPLTTGYTAYGSLGQYTVNGTVIDPSGNVAPVAVAKVTPTSGDAPLNVAFDGSLSSDSDGDIVSYSWDFGDGSIGSGPIVQHTYQTAGNYKATLTVKDDDNHTDTVVVAIEVLQANLSPIARISASPTSGSIPLTVTFNGASSIDSDGTIVSYQWNFGDGTSGSSANIQHIYQAIGIYTAVLKVTDNRGATGTANLIIQVQQDASKILRVSSIQLTVLKTTKGLLQAKSTVSISNPGGTSIAGAKVTGSWSGVVTGTASGTTDASGNVVLTSKTFKKSGTVSFKVTTVTKTGYVYDPTRNLTNQASISFY